MYAQEYLALVAGLVIVTYFLSGPMGTWGAAGLILALLAYFKLHGETVSLAGVALTQASATTALLPLGFSFLAFELLHFAVERHRGTVSSASLIDLAAFAFFFPCRVAGPIKRYPEFVAAVSRAEPSIENLYQGGLRILVGLFKKVALADLLGLTAAEIGYVSTPFHAWKVVLAYSLQIYLDFSAYSDIAIGLSRLMGIRVSENFQTPYLAQSIQEFWSRWHISLSSWVRDYVFMGLGRRLFRTPLKSQPRAVATICYLTTFVVLGAWHGLTPGFLAWGAYHGLLLTAYHLYRTWMPVGIATSRLYRSGLTAWVGTALTFFFVTIGWVFFMVDLTKGFNLLRLMFWL